MSATPGPWEAAIEDPEDCAVFTVNEEFICNIGNDRVICVPPKEGKHVVAFDMDIANAHLIAAAPELLEAAKEMIDSTPTRYGKMAREKLLAAISKAEGEDAP